MLALLTVMHVANKSGGGYHLENIGIGGSKELLGLMQRSLRESGYGGVPISVVSQKFGFLSVVTTIMALSVIYGKVWFLTVQIYGNISEDLNYSDDHHIPVLLEPIDTKKPQIRTHDKGLNGTILTRKVKDKSSHSSINDSS